MIKAPAPADLQRWSEDVARDPSSLSFLPLARAYRKQGRRDAALKLCLRGLEHHPTYVPGHALLAMLYFESGQRAKAYDEWSMVLRLEPDNFDALRGMGFYHLEQGDDASALRSLQRAVSLRPTEVTVLEALKMIHERNQPSAPPTHMLDRDPWDETPAPAAVHTPSFEPPPLQHAAPPPPPTPAAAPAQSPVPPAVSTRPTVELPSDPTQLFDVLMRGGQILGALLLDQQGLVLAGKLAEQSGSKAEALGAILGGAIEEATRTTAHLALGSWRGILLDAEKALLHLTPVREGMIVLLAAKRETPTGWVLRSAHQAAQLADRFLEAYA